jgi:hypothetical protein
VGPPSVLQKVVILLDLKVFVFINICKCGIYEGYWRVWGRLEREAVTWDCCDSAGEVSFKPAPSEN